MSESNVFIRLSLKDADTTKRALEAIGADGERALKRIESAGRAPTAGMQALSAASNETRAALGGLASNAGPAGSALSALGASGLAAAAGLGAIALAMTAAIQKSREVIQFFGDLADSAERVGTSASRMEALNRVALENAGSIEKVSTALESLQVNAQKAVDGDEKLAAAFERNGVSMQFLREQGGDAVVVFNELSKANLSAADAAELMGKAGKSLLPTISALHGEVDTLANTKLDPLAKEFDAVADASAKLDRQFNELGAGGSLEIQKQFLAIKQGLFDLEKWFLRTADANSKFWENLRRSSGPLSLVDEAKRLEAEKDGAGGGLTVELNTPTPAPKPLMPSGGVGRVSAPKPPKASAGARSNDLNLSLGVPFADERGDKLGTNQGTWLGEAPDFAKDVASQNAMKASWAKTFETIRDANLRSHDEIVKLIELRRDRDIAAINVAAGNDAEKAEARRLIADTASQEIIAANDKAAESLTTASGNLFDATGLVADGFNQIGVSATSAFEDAIIKGGKLSDVLTGLGEDFQRILLRKTVSEPLSKMLDMGIGAGSNFLSGLFSGSSGASLPLGGGTGAGGFESGGFQTMFDGIGASADATKDAASAMSASAVDLGKGGAAGDLSGAGRGMVGVIGQAMTALVTAVSSASAGSSAGSSAGGFGGFLASLFGGGGSAGGLSTAGGTATGGYSTGGFQTTPIFAKGGAFDNGNVIPFAHGGIVSKPTTFPMARGMGLMGEAGPEAVMPLARTAAGNLGVRAMGGSAPTVNLTVVNNGVPAEAKTETKDNGRGGMDIEMTLDPIVAAVASKQGSMTNRALQSDGRGPRR